MEINFMHLKHIFEESSLMRYTSPHFSNSEAGSEIRNIVLKGLEKQHEFFGMEFLREQLLCANEVFPEAAVADPFADLEIWNEWRSGSRAFPYPGKYSRLGITVQEPKTSSKISIGMIGEIFAGLFSQSYLGPWVLVRVIRRWPDFIYYTRDGRYAFIESKAFTFFNQHLLNIINIPQDELGQCLFEAAQQLNTDPFVKVWLSFTAIRNIDPFKADVIFLELDAPNRRRENVAVRVVPPAVIKGLAYRAITHAASDLPPLDIIGLGTKPPGKKSDSRKAAESRLILRANEMIEEELLDVSIEKSFLPNIRKEVEREIEIQVGKSFLQESYIGKKYELAKRRAAEGKLSYIRSIGSAGLYIADIPRVERREMEKTWTPNWADANKPWKTVNKKNLWRGSSAVFAIGSEEINNLLVTEEN